MNPFSESHLMRLDAPHSDPKSARRRLLLPATIAGLIGLAFTGVGFGLHHLSNEIVWDRFDTVKPGVLYRSGQMSPEQLREAIERYGIRTVVNFQVRDRTLAAEEKLVRSTGAQFVNLPMPGNGFGQEEQFREVLALVDDPAKRPVLIHCSAGTCRTGAAVAMYRFERDGWTIDDVSAEMDRQAYDSGWISGYIFNMLKNRPHFTLRDESSEQSDLIEPDQSEPDAESVISREAREKAELRR